jgi:hypothetical protein
MRNRSSRPRCHEGAALGGTRCAACPSVDARMTPRSKTLVGAAAIAIVLIAIAYGVAPRSCQGGLEIYFGCGVVAILLLAALPFATRLGTSIVLRGAASVGCLAFGLGAWVVGMIAANVRFICGLGYL